MVREWTEDVIRASIVEIFIASIKTLDEMEINFRV